MKYDPRGGFDPKSYGMGFPKAVKFFGRVYYFLLQHLICRTIGFLVVRKITGLENIPPGGPFLVVPNHSSFVDFMLVIDCLRKRRYLAFFVKKKYFDMKKWNHFLSRMGHIRADSHSIRRALAVLKEGCPVVLFAEGTRTRTGSMGDAYPGLGIVGSKAGVPVIPMGIKGAYELWPWNKKVPNLLQGRQIDISFGKPVSFECFSGVDEFAKKVMGDVKKMT